jgi:subtilisin family serine protease
MALSVLAITALVAVDLSTQGRRGRASVLVDGREAVDGEVLVQFRDQADVFEQARAADEIDADEVESLGRRGNKRMRARSMHMEELLARLRANPDVEFVEPNYIIRLSALPNDPGFGNLWGLFNFGQDYGGVGVAGSDIDATLAWDVSTGNRANVIGIVDTGVDYNHPDLAANVWTAPSAFSVTVGGVVINCAAGTHGFNAITNSCNPIDDNDHGTHVAGTIGAVGNNGVGVVGLNWTASMMALKALDRTGSGTTANAIKAIEFAVQAKAVLGTNVANVRVLSNSWTGDAFSQSLLNEINRSNTANMLFVAAAGNSGLNNDISPTYPASFSAPNIIAVAATNNLDQRASFSNYGATTVHLGAPGVAILSTTINGTYSTFSGTSMATPHVSGAAALVLSACSLTTAGLKATILNTVDPIPAMAGVTTTGGRLNVNNAIRSCAPSSTVNVPNVAGLTQAAATTSLTTAGLAVGTVTTASSATVPAGSVISQTPGSGTSVAVGSAVNLTVSSGPAGTRVNVAATANGGSALASSFYNASYPAAGALDGNRRGWGGGTGWNDGTPNAGPDWLEIHFVGAQPITEVDVFSVQDAYTAPVEPVLGQTFSLYGVTDFQVEYWTGTQWALIPGGAIVGNTQVWRQLLFTPVTTTAIRITVTRTPDGWTRLTEVEAYTTAPGSTVSVPNVVGLTQAAATTSLTTAGLAVGTVTTASSATVPAGSVISQTPGSGTSVAVGSAVNLTVSSGPAGTRVNVAATANGGSALASSFYNASYPAAGALDGNRRGWGGGTGWNDGTPNAGPDWLEIHFVGAQPITEVDVFSVQDAYTAPVEPVLGQTFSLYGVTDFQVEYWTVRSGPSSRAAPLSGTRRSGDSSSSRPSRPRRFGSRSPARPMAGRD